MNKYCDPILIASPPRSGSSLLAYMLSKEGIQIGNTKIADKYNQHGYFENIRVTKLLIKYLRKNDIDKLDRRYQPINLDTDLPNFNRRLYRVLRRESFEKGKPYLFKDPKIVLTWKLWNKYCPNAKWILLHRNEDSILNSYHRADFMDMYQEREDWKQYLYRFHDNMKGIESECKNVFKVDIADIFNNNSTVIKQLFDFVGVESKGEYLKCIDKTLLKL